MTSSHQHHILIVDDDHAQAEALEDFLTDKGYTVTLAFTADEGRDKVFDQRPDLIVLDLYLPDRKGSELSQELRGNPLTRDIPIILCTAHQVTAEQKLQGFQSGVDDYLLKPFHLGELEARIQAILRRSRVLPKTELLAGIEAVLQKSQTPAPPPLPSTANGQEIKDALWETETQPTSEEELMASEPLFFWRRVKEILLRPQEVFQRVRSHQDFLIAVMLVVATPAMASVSRLSQRTADFDAWIGLFSLGIVTHLIMWTGTGGLLQMTAPFLGTSVPSRVALTIAGLAWVPRLIAAALSAVYPLVARAGVLLDQAEFSAGINLIPGLPSNDWINFLSRMGIFEFWSASLTMAGVAVFCGVKRKRDPILLLIGAVCVAFGALTPY